MVKLFHIDVNDEMKKIIESIQIDRNIDPFRTYQHDSDRKWKSFDGDLYSVIFDGIKNASDNNSSSTCDYGAQILTKLLNNMVIKMKTHMNLDECKKLFWLRFETPTTEFDIPRWHTDGFYFSSKDEKFVVSLKGNGTMIAKCENNSHTLQQMKAIHNEYPDYTIDSNNKYVHSQVNYDKRNELVAPILDKECEIIQLCNWKGVIYNVGNNENACIHSDPKKDAPRIFVGLVLGV